MENPTPPVRSEFKAASIILPVMNETVSLARTVEIILRDVKDDTAEILVVVCKRTSAESMEVLGRLQRELGGLLVVHHQTLPFLGGAMREAFARARGSHVVMMASDLETDPNDLRELIGTARRHPDAVVTASRWLKGGSFEGYSTVKLLLNWVFQHLFSVLYGVHLTDMTYAYRVFPTSLVQSIRWEELRHPFLFESLVKPLRLGVEVVEIASAWKARCEGESQNTFFRNFAYFRTGLKTRFMSKQSLLAKCDGKSHWREIPEAR